MCPSYVYMSFTRLDVPTPSQLAGKIFRIKFQCISLNYVRAPDKFAAAAARNPVFKSCIDGRYNRHP